MNELSKETSPYLIQHAANPVHWKAWNATSLELAKKEEKLLLVSVGYSACHWCHVMEHESFENKEIAAIMNEHFVSIKVDREERPDIDQVYMDAAYLITGQGGWPLNAICLPDGRPVYAGTYFRPEQWKQILLQLANLWQTNAAKLEEQASLLMERAQSFALIPEHKDKTEEIDFEQLLARWLQLADWKYGGEQGSPKFPMPSTIELQLMAGSYLDHERSQEFALFTIEQIASGGIYDHIGGGFARYSVDEQWHVPHFEKMLFDNAQLLSVLAKAYQINKNTYFKETAVETISFLLREMRSPNQLFYSAYDADSEGEEGKFYVFSQAEINAVLAENSKLFSAYFDVSEEGNWEGKNVLRIIQKKEALEKQYSVSVAEFDLRIAASKQQLLAYREQRVKPDLDYKQLTAWNALTITAFCDAYKAFGEEEYKKIALETAQALVNLVVKENGQVTRNFAKGKATINGFLDDYSFLAEACINLYEITFDTLWLQQAERLLNYVKNHFYDNQTKLFFYTSNQDEQLVLRKKETSDNVIPASNSSMFKAMFKLAKLTGNTSVEQDVIETISAMKSTIEKNPRFYSNWLQLALLIQHGSKEIAIVGKNAHQIRKQLQAHFLPNGFYLGGETDTELSVLNGKLVEGKTLIYVCENHTCKQPVESVEEALELLKK